jgi:cell division protein FtsI/penicillin-binding protein 2
VQGSKLASEAVSQQTEAIALPSLRGSLLDRRGNALAASEDAATIFAVPPEITKPALAAEKLASILGLDERKVLSDVTAETTYSVLAKKVDLPTAKRIERLDLQGIGQDPDSRRTYPQGELAAQVIGAVGSENQGLSGLELGEESVLHGSDGERRIVTDASGEPIRLETAHEAEDGENIQLTLDPAIEQKTEEALGEVGETYAPKGATAIVMDPRNSQILAMANWPPVDPSDLSEASPEDLMNRATGFNYEPGSTFKAFTVAAALEEGVVTPESSFYLPSQLHVADRVIEDAEARPPVTLTVGQILAQSSNVGAVTIGLKLGAERFSKWIDRFGFGRPTGVRLDDGEPADGPGPLGDADADDGRLPGDRRWRHPQATAAGREGRRRTGSGAEGAPGDQRRCGGAGARNARGRAGSRRHRLGGERAGLQAGGEDRNRAGGRKRDLLRNEVRCVLHWVCAGSGSATAGFGDCGSAAGGNLRRICRCSGLWEDCGVCVALSRGAVGITRGRRVPLPGRPFVSQ